MAFWKSATMMRRFWLGCVVMGLTYALFLWEGNGTLMFVIGQVFMGSIGLAREAFIAKRPN